MRNIFTIIAFIILSNTLQSQTIKQKIIRCFTVEQIKKNRSNNPNIQSDQQFETWLQPLVKQHKHNKVDAQYKVPVLNYTLPIIFHIVHDAEAVGSGNNIVASRIQAQILQLNKDYANLSGSPYSVSASSGIQFALARTDPNGTTLAEPGIERISRNTKSWSAPPYTADYVDTSIKPNSFWDPTRFINIWLVDMKGDGILGFSTFPSTSTLSGLDNSETNATAGLAVDPATVGSIFSSTVCGSTINPYTLGKTMTHEMGHFLGLRHIWGDQDPTPCATDYCDDTPIHRDANYGKPSHPKANTCGTADEMFENYMDYTDDDILNTFTADQIDRMQTVLLNSPRRKTLPNSNVGFSFPAGSNKLGFALCSGAITVPETANAGTTNRYKDFPIVLNVENVATGNAVVTFSVTGTAVNNLDYQLSANTVNFVAGNAAKSINLRIFDNVTNDGNKTIILNYTISGTGVTANTTGQSLTITVIDDDIISIANNMVTLLTQNFNGPVTGWTTLSDGGANNFTVTGTNGSAGGTGNCAYVTSSSIIKPNNYDTSSASIAILSSPLINAQGYKNLSLSFKYRVWGEKDADGTYDYGALNFAPKGTLVLTSFNTRLDGPYVGTTAPLTGTISTASVNLLAGTQFYLGFYWENDNNIGNNPALNVDDVVLTGDATKIETNISNSYTYNIVSTSSANSYFKSIGNDNIIATVKNVSSQISNVVASVTEAGIDRLNITSGATTFLRSRKVIKVSPSIIDNTTQHTTTIYFTTAEVATWPNATILKVIKINNSTTTNDNLNTTNSSLLSPIVDDRRIAEGYIAYTVTTTGFGSFILVDAATVLPVSLLSFGAKAEINTVILNWVTTNEVNNLGFNLQRSTDASVFTSINLVASKNEIINNYSYTDASVTASTRYYYRIQQKDIDGKTSLSNTITVLFNGKNSSIKISPNPFSNFITVQYNVENAPITITIFDVLGRKVYENKAAGIIKINTEQWMKGGYIIKINDGNVIQNYKVIKN